MLALSLALPMAALSQPPVVPADGKIAFEISPKSVVVARLPLCAVQNCLLLPTFSEAGTLTVMGPGDREGWFLERSNVPAGQAFAMNLLNHAYGNCNTSFSHPSMTIDTAKVSFSFLVENHPERVCVTDIRPHGPRFEMPAMRPGRYPVFVSTPPACVYAEKSCAIWTEPQLSDTLIVSETSAILQSALPAKAGGSAAFTSEGTRVMVTLPGGAEGEWRAELMTVAGRRLSAGTVPGGSGARTALELGSRPELGIYMLRLSAPDGKTPYLAAGQQGLSGIRKGKA